jgi:hypothetical protein
MTANHSEVPATGGEGDQRQPRLFDVDRGVNQNWRSPRPLLAVRFPSMRREAIDFLDLISDPIETAAVWVDHDQSHGLVRGGWLPQHVLSHLDDCLSFDEPEQMVGLTLRTDEEIVLVRALGQAIDAVQIQETDSATVSTRGWVDLRSHAYKLATAKRIGDARAPLYRAAAQRTLEQIDPQHLATLATDALLSGLDTPYLREAAGARPDDHREPTFLFDRALDELAIERPKRSLAVETLLFDALVETATGLRDPVDTAHWIWHTMHGLTEHEGDLRIFIGLASEHEDRPSAHQEISDAIVDAAIDILNRGFLRRWICLQARPNESPLALTSIERRELVPLSGVDITTDLKHRLLEWAEEFDEAQQRPGRGPSNFASPRAPEEFVRRGERLTLDLQQELGPEWHVEYMPTPRAFP